MKTLVDIQYKMNVDNSSGYHMHLDESDEKCLSSYLDQGLLNADFRVLANLSTVCDSSDLFF